MERRWLMKLTHTKIKLKTCSYLGKAFTDLTKHRSHGYQEARFIFDNYI